MQFFTTAAKIPSQDSSLIVQEIIQNEEGKRKLSALLIFSIMYI